MKRGRLLHSPAIQDAALLALLVAIVFGRIVGHDFQSDWDDNWFILYNDAVRGFSLQHLRSAFSSYIVGSYVPLQTISFMLDYSIWGLAPAGFLLTNLVLHAVNGILVYRLFISCHADRMLALCGAALFLVHPVQVESVAWISNRKTLLAMLFFLLAWHAYDRYRKGETTEKWRHYAASLAAFSLALLAKSIAVIFPLVLILYDACFPATARRIYLRDKIPFVAAAVAIAVISMISQSEPGGGRVPYHGGSVLATTYTMATVFCRYLRMLVWPTGLSAWYAPTVHRTLDPVVAASFLLLAAVSVGGFLMFRRDRRLGFWFLFSVIGFLPVSQIVPMLCIMADRYFYFPMIGLAAIAVFGAALLWPRGAASSRLPLLCLLVSIVVALSTVSFHRAALWRDSLTLWSDAAAKEPGSDKVWEIVGAVHAGAGRKAEAVGAYERGLKLNPANTEILNGLGDLYTEADELDRGEALLLRLLEIRPAYVTGWAALGTNYLKRNRFAEAEQAYLRARELQPEAVQVVRLLGNLSFVQGHYEEAARYYEQVERRGEGDAETAYRLACAGSRRGKNDDALQWLEAALQRGFADDRAIRGDAALSGVRKDPRFVPLVGRHLGQ